MGYAGVARTGPTKSGMGIAGGCIDRANPSGLWPSGGPWVTLVAVGPTVRLGVLKFQVCGVPWYPGGPGTLGTLEAGWGFVRVVGVPGTWVLVRLTRLPSMWGAWVVAFSGPRYPGTQGRGAGVGTLGFRRSL